MIIHVDPDCQHPPACERRQRDQAQQMQAQQMQAQLQVLQALCVDIAGHADRAQAERDDIGDAGTGVLSGRLHCGRGSVHIRKQYDGLVYWPTAYVVVRLRAHGASAAEPGPAALTPTQCLGAVSGAAAAGELAAAVRGSVGEEEYQRVLQAWRIREQEQEQEQDGGARGVDWMTAKEAGLRNKVATAASEPGHSRLGYHLLERGLQRAIPGFHAFGDAELMFRMPAASAGAPARLSDIMSVVDRVFALLGKPAFEGTACVYLVPAFHRHLAGTLVRCDPNRRIGKLARAAEALRGDALARAAQWVHEDGEFLNAHAEVLAPLLTACVAAATAGDGSSDSADGSTGSI